MCKCYVRTAVQRIDKRATIARSAYAYLKGFTMPALGGSQFLSRQYLDYSGERKSVTIPVQEITALTIAAFLGDASDFEVALDAVVLGTAAKSEWGARDVLSNTRPSDKDAQVETEMLVELRDATTEQPFSFRIPTVDYTKFNYADPPAGDTVIISGAGASAETVALVTAIETVARSPFNDANLVEVIGMRVVR